MLKTDRIEPRTHDIEWYFNNVAERGGVAAVDATAGPSGGYPGSPKSVASYASNPSGAVPLGLLLYDVVSYDTNRQHDNWYKSGFQARTGMKVAIARDGRFVTNMIPTGLGTAVAVGQPAYLAANGLISNVQATGAPQVGTWLGAVDQDGYAKLQVNIR